MEILALKVQRDDALEQKREIKELRSELAEQKKMMQEMINLVKKQNTTQNIIQNTNTQNNAPHNFGNITINSYQNPSTDGLALSMADIDSHTKIAYALIEKIYFNPEKPENHSIYLVNKKDKTLMVYKDEKWHALTTDKDRDMLTTELQNIIIQKGTPVVNRLYNDDEDMFIKLPKDISDRIIAYNGLEPREVRMNNCQLLQYALKHKMVKPNTINNTLDIK